MRDERENRRIFSVCTQQSTKVTRLLWYYWQFQQQLFRRRLLNMCSGFAADVLLVEFIFRFRIDESNSMYALYSLYVFRTLQHVVFVEMKSTFSGFAKSRMKKKYIGNRSRLHSRTPLELNVCTRATFEMQQRWQ